MQEAVQYVNYSEYKNIDGVDVQWPLEISEDIATDVIDFVKRNMKASDINSNFCKALRELLDKKYGKSWNVFIGKNFGSYAIHDRYNFMYFKYRTYYFLVYKTTV